MASVLVKVRGDGTAFRTMAGKAFGKKPVIEPILTVPGKAAGRGMAAEKPATWLRMDMPGGAVAEPDAA